MISTRRKLSSMYFIFNSWVPIDTIEYGGKTMYLDYEGRNIMELKLVLKAYRKYGLDYHVERNCLGIYEVYCEKILWGGNF